jgi:hypothetical protein
MVFPHKLEKNNKNVECKDEHKKIARKENEWDGSFFRRVGKGRDHNSKMA